MICLDPWVGGKQVFKNTTLFKAVQMGKIRITAFGSRGQ
jgi:hypothetical protein